MAMRVRSRCMLCMAGVGCLAILSLLDGVFRIGEDGPTAASPEGNASSSSRASVIAGDMRVSASSAGSDCCALPEPASQAAWELSEHIDSLDQQEWADVVRRLHSREVDEGLVVACLDSNREVLSQLALEQILGGHAASKRLLCAVRRRASRRPVAPSSIMALRVLARAVPAEREIWLGELLRFVGVDNQDVADEVLASALHLVHEISELVPRRIYVERIVDALVDHRSTSRSLKVILSPEARAVVTRRDGALALAGSLPSTWRSALQEAANVRIDVRDGSGEVCQLILHTDEREAIPRLCRLLLSSRVGEGEKRAIAWLLCRRRALAEQHLDLLVQTAVSSSGFVRQQLARWVHTLPDEKFQRAILPKLEGRVRSLALEWRKGTDLGWPIEGN